MFGFGHSVYSYMYCLLGPVPDYGFVVTLEAETVVAVATAASDQTEACGTTCELHDQPAQSVPNVNTTVNLLLALCFYRTISIIGISAYLMKQN